MRIVRAPPINLTASQRLFQRQCVQQTKGRKALVDLSQKKVFRKHSVKKVSRSVQKKVQGAKDRKLSHQAHLAVRKRAQRGRRHVLAGFRRKGGGHVVAHRLHVSVERGASLCFVNAVVHVVPDRVEVELALNLIAARKALRKQQKWVQNDSERDMQSTDQP